MSKPPHCRPDPGSGILGQRRLEDPPGVLRSHLWAKGLQFRASHVFCAFGTTIKQAGSRERFRQVDFGYPLRVAELARAAGVRHFLLVSSIGASPESWGFYLQAKGELERAIVSLGFPATTMVRPSLLLGDRQELRLGEVVASRLAWAYPRKYRPVHVRDVAKVLADAAVDDRPGIRIIDYPEISERPRAP